MDHIHPTIAVISSSLSVRTRHRSRNVISSDADEVFPGLSTDVVIVLLEGNEEHVHVKGWEIDLVDVEVCYILCERGALRRCEGVGMGIDSPERHGCYLGCLWACKNWLLLLLESIKS